MFIDHARQVIFGDNEIRTLQGLLREYKTILGTYGLPTLGIKSSYVKEVLVRQFGAGIGFYDCPQKNQSEVMCTILAAVVYILKLLSLDWRLAMSS